MISSIKLFAIIYFITIAFIYAFHRKIGKPIVVPGDIYIRKEQKYVYIPLGLSFVLTLILFLIFNGLRVKMGIEF